MRLRVTALTSAMAMLAGTAAHADDIDWKKELGSYSGKTLRVMTITDPFIDSIKKTKDAFTTLTGAKVEVDGYGYDALHEKELLSCTQHDSNYDVLIIDGIWIGEFTEAGCLDSVEKRIAKEPRIVAWDDYTSQAAEQASWNGERVCLPETTCYPRPSAPIPIIVGGGGEKRTLAIAARLGDGCNLHSEIATLDRKLAIFRQHCVAAGRDPAQAEVTVLDTPVIGRDREDAASIVEKLRGRTAAAVFARRHHAGPAGEHIGRYRLLADRGVKTVFVSLPQLTGPEDVLCLAPLAAAFA